MAVGATATEKTGGTIFLRTGEVHTTLSLVDLLSLPLRILNATTLNHPVLEHLPSTLPVYNIQLSLLSPSHPILAGTNNPVS